LSIEENKAIVRGYMEEFLNKGDLSAIDRYLNSDGVNFNGKHLSRSEILFLRQPTLTVFPDLNLTIEDQIAEGDKVVTSVIFHGTQQGEFHGIPPTGKKVAYQGIAIDRIVNGKVKEMWHEADTLGMFRQLGAVPRLEK